MTSPALSKLRENVRLLLTKNQPHRSYSCPSSRSPGKPAKKFAAEGSPDPINPSGPYLWWFGGSLKRERNATHHCTVGAVARQPTTAQCAAGLIPAQNNSFKDNH
uniref:SFRICE_014314 n=1 Tax=Spodoptera frugiperda TaxID=7108 RepID=A0A2H1VTW0_SPOFR